MLRISLLNGFIKDTICKPYNIWIHEKLCYTIQYFEYDMINTYAQIKYTTKTIKIYIHTNIISNHNDINTNNIDIYININVNINISNNIKY